ncbi:MAG: hypothetical protein V7631_3191 [Massilia sp.]|jgi:hypothetical protein
MNKPGCLAVAVTCMLAATMSLPAGAIPPPPPPPCIPASPAVTVEALAGVLAGKGESRQQECAAKDLAARGAAGVPVAVRLLGVRDSNTVMLALMALADMGPHAQAALPALMERIRKATAAGDKYLYDAVAAIGPGARPAIPLLITKSRDPRQRYLALRALGRLGKHDASRVVPYLESMLQGRQHEETVLDALSDIGKDARAALPATLVSLEQAKAAGDHMHGASAVNALLAIGEPGESIPVLTGLLHDPVLANDAVLGLARLGPAAASAVPALIAKLASSRYDSSLPDNIASALATIAPGSPAVQRQLLVESTQYQNEMAAIALAAISPLPPDFAPALAAVLARKPGDYFLGKALENTRRVK